MTGSYAIDFMILSEVARVALILNPLVLQPGTAFPPEEGYAGTTHLA